MFGPAGMFPWLLYSNSLFNVPDIERTISSDIGFQKFSGIVAYKWKREIRFAGADRRWILSIPGSDPSQVSFNGQVQHAFTSDLGYVAYCFEGEGVVEVDLPPGIVPELTEVPVGSRGAVELSTQTATVQAPLTRSEDGTLTMSDTVIIPSGAYADLVPFRPELDSSGSVLFHFNIAESGFYKVRCLARSGGQRAKSLEAYVAVDQYNSQDHNSLVPRRALHTMKKGSQRWDLVTTWHPIPLGAGDHTLRIYLRQPDQQIGNVKLVSSLP